MGTAGVCVVSIEAFVRCAACQCTILLGSVVDAVTCRRCFCRETMPADRWRRILDAAVHDAPALREDGEDAIVRSIGDTVRVTARRAQPTCAACDTTLSRDVVLEARRSGRCVCSSCQAILSTRQPPAWATSALPRVSHILGEDATQLLGRGASPPGDGEAVIVPCPQCGGGVAAGGTRRATKCSYCSAMVVLPEWALRRLNDGECDPLPFYVLVDVTLPRASFRADVVCNDVEAVATDADGNLYGIGDDDEIAVGDEQIVFGLDAELQTKWVRRNLELKDDTLPEHVMVTSNGLLVLWSPSCSSALLLRSRDGADAGVLGGCEPQGAATHALDFEGAHGAACDQDGTFLLVKRGRLARLGPDGGGVRTWPQASGFFARIFEGTPGAFGEDDDDDGHIACRRGSSVLVLRADRMSRRPVTLVSTTATRPSFAS